MDQTTQERKCLTCPLGCAACGVNFELKVIECSECATGYSLDGKLCKPKAGTQECADGTFKGKLGDGTVGCLACPPGCKLCMWNASTAEVQCTICGADFTLD